VLISSITGSLPNHQLSVPAASVVCAILDPLARVLLAGR
jgi:hypothetical protein